jgi:hypothetical protein
VREHGDKIRLHPAPTALRTTNRRRRPALRTGAALAAVVLVAGAVLIFTATREAPPAYAVTTNPDGTVTVTLNDIQAITALNAELARDGLRAKAVPLTATCPTRGFPNMMPSGTNASTYTITIVPADIPAGYTAVLAASESPSGQVQLAQGAWPSPGPSCLNTTPLFSAAQIAHSSQR